MSRLVGRPRRLSVAYSRTRRRSAARILIWILVRVLIGILARILRRALIRILILRPGIGRGDLTILRIGRRSCLTPVPLLTRGRCLL